MKEDDRGVKVKVFEREPTAFEVGQADMERTGSDLSASSRSTCGISNLAASAYGEFCALEVTPGT